MKLIYCRECQDIVKLARIPRRCFCGKSGEQYQDAINATISGPCIPIGIANSAFLSAMQNRPESGQGECFEAFVIPKKCPTVVENKE